MLTLNFLTIELNKIIAETLKYYWERNDDKYLPKIKHERLCRVAKIDSHGNVARRSGRQGI